MNYDNLNLAHNEKVLIRLALEQGGSIIKASELLGISRHALKRRMTKYGIEAPPPEPQPRLDSKPEPESKVEREEGSSLTMPRFL